MAETPPLKSRRPYLLRAMHEWITDNQHTPHIVVDAGAAGVEVPRQYVQGGKIILNVSLSATNGLSLGNDAVSFRGRFGSVTHDVRVPISAVLGIYSRETGQHMIFTEADVPPPAATEGKAPGKGEEKEKLTAVPSRPADAAGRGSTPTGGKPAGKKGKPTLTVIK